VVAADFGRCVMLGTVARIDGAAIDPVLSDTTNAAGSRPQVERDIAPD
jgi:hypothetical protein